MLFVEEVSDSDADSHNESHSTKNIQNDNRNVSDPEQMNVSEKPGESINPNNITLSPKDLIKKLNKVYPIDQAPSTSIEAPNVQDTNPKIPDAHREHRGSSDRDQAMVWVQKSRKTFNCHDEMKTIEDTLLYELLKELFICMKVSGRLRHCLNFYKEYDIPILYMM